MSEKSHDRTEDELKFEIYKVVKKLSEDRRSLPVYVRMEVPMWDIKKELPDTNENTIIDLLDKLTFYDRKLARIDTYCSRFYVPI